MFTCQCDAEFTRCLQGLGRRNRIRWWLEDGGKEEKRLAVTEKPETEIIKFKKPVATESDSNSENTITESTIPHHPTTVNKQPLLLPLPINPDYIFIDSQAEYPRYYHTSQLAHEQVLMALVQPSTTTPPPFRRRYSAPIRRNPYPATRSRTNFDGKYIRQPHPFAYDLVPYRYF